jgi:hypothetical protein
MLENRNISINMGTPISLFMALLTLLVILAGCKRDHIIVQGA